jgi:uncharacterized membrane protein YbhN (UPF0104 family)
LKLNTKKLINIIGVIIMLAALAFVVKTFLSFDMDYSDLLSRKYALAVSGAVAVTVLAVVLNAYCWGKIISLFSGKHLEFKVILNMYAKSNLGKYLPSNIGHFAGRQIYGASLGLNQSALAVASVSEVLYNAGAAFLLSVIFAWNKIFETAIRFLPESNMPLSVAGILLAGGAAFTVLFFVYQKNKHFKMLISMIKTPASLILFLRGLIVSATVLLLMGLLFAQLIWTNAPNNADNAAFVIAAAATSWLIGFITPGVPGGIGVRETVLVLMLSPVFPKEAVLTAAVLQRFAMIVGDVLAWTLGEVLVRTDDL